MEIKNYTNMRKRDDFPSVVEAEETKSLDGAESGEETISVMPSKIEIDSQFQLRLLSENDASAILAILKKAPEIQKYVTWVVGIETLEQTKEHIARYREGNTPLYGVHESDQFVGYVGIWPLENNECYLGYFLDPNEQGKGIVTRASEALMAEAVKTLQTQKFVLCIADENDASQAVAARLGAVPTEQMIFDDILQCEERIYTLEF